MKKKPSAQILEIYRHNKARLQGEEQKTVKDRTVVNNIAAYTHIVRSMEELYDLPDTPVHQNPDPDE